jgi:hypothetical protein
MAAAATAARGAGESREGREGVVVGGVGVESRL